MRFTLSLLSLIACLSVASAAEDIMVFAAASLTESLKEVGGAYTKKTGKEVKFNFAGSNTLAQQIRAGAPADVFFSADEAQMNSLEKTGLIATGTRRNVLGNTLVIVVPRGATGVRKPADLQSTAVRHLSLGDTRAVPAGVYAKAWLIKEGLWENLHQRVVPAENVRAALAAVAAGNAEAGIVYKTDATITRDVDVVWEIPATDTPGIVYPAALTADSRKGVEAGKFLKWLGTEDASRTFQKYGFTVVSPTGNE